MFVHFRILTFIGVKDLDARVSLKKNFEFRRLYTKGKSAVTPFVVVYCRRNGQGCNRLGYTVSTKLGKAVERNRVRRRLREIYRLNAHSLKSGYDIVIVARGRCVDGDYHKMESAFLKACSELGLTIEKETV